MNFYKTYKWLVPSLLLTILMLATRMVYTGSITFVFIIWNLILAVLPLVFVYKLQQTTNNRHAWCYALLWLLFFPNAMYITTDLFHLRERPEIPLWFDMLFLLSAALNGVIMGFHSLFAIERWLQSIIKRQYVAATVFCLLMLCGYGIYLGRYQRWNSWDVVAQPGLLLVDIGHHIVHPFRNAEVWLLSIFFSLWMFVFYKYLKKVRKTT